MVKCTASRLCKRPGVIVAGSRLTPCLAHLAKKKERKYRNRPAVSETIGRRFDSDGERRRAEELVMLEKAGAIRNLRFQVRYDLSVNGIKVCGYIADFVYEDCRTACVGYDQVVEDYKGYETPEFRIKAKLFRAVMGFDIQVVRPERKNFVLKGAKK